MKHVDSYRYLDTTTRLMVRSWIGLEKSDAVPWTPLSKPLRECTIALISSGGLALKSDAPFDQEIERQDPWRSDSSYRVLPRTATAQDIRVYHLHVNPALAESDINVLLPVERLNALAESGEIGQVAPSHYAYIGYVIDTQCLMQDSVPAIIRQLEAEQVDVVVLVPA